jgi:hypothetical protein
MAPSPPNVAGFSLWARDGKGARVEALILKVARGETRLSVHDRFRFSVTLHTDDIAVLFCLRALCRWAQPSRGLGPGGREIGYGGTKADEWKAAAHRATFRFTEESFMKRFTEKAAELLPGRWQQVSESPNDPATKQR